MPVYNAAPFLQEAIDSILSQTFTDFEFIIINDGSTDESPEIIQSYQDSRIRYFSQENKGVSRSLNQGLTYCRGKYIRRFDSDDIAGHEEIQTQYDFLESNEEVGLVSMQVRYITSNGKKSYLFREPSPAFFKGEERKTISVDDFNPNCPVVHGTVLMRRDLVTKLGGYRTAFLTSEDTDLWLRMMDESKIVVLNRCTYFFRLGNASATEKHKLTLGYYKSKAIEYALERIQKGSDPLMRGGKLEHPMPEKYQKKPGRTFRSDLLSYLYKVAWNARDLKMVTKIIAISLKDGFLCGRTWRALFYPVRQKLRVG